MCRWEKNLANRWTIAKFANVSHYTVFTVAQMATDTYVPLSSNVRLNIKIQYRIWQHFQVENFRGFTFNCEYFPTNFC